MQMQIQVYTVYVDEYMQKWTYAYHYFTFKQIDNFLFSHSSYLEKNAEAIFFKIKKAK